jgi:CheY-like chemotaxis protein
MARILVIDDNATDRLLTMRALEQMGHAVETETGGAAALRRLAGSRFDLIVVDIFMENMDGLEFLRAKTGLTDAPILAISGGGSVVGMDFLKAAGSLGADAVLHKPIACAELKGAVTALLAGRRQTAAKTASQHPDRGTLRG